MVNPEKQATFGTQDTTRGQEKTTTQNSENQKILATRTPSKTGGVNPAACLL